jgi:hypothetical protein
LKVAFKDKIVQSIEESEGAPEGGGGIKIVPAPVIVR